MAKGMFPPPPPWAAALPAVGVTGTNGKTTTTAWVAAALRAGTGAAVVRATTVGMFVDDERLELPATHDGFIKAMRTGLDRGARSAAIELTSEALALGFAAAWPVRVGVFTNLSRDHLDSHGSAEHYLASKAQLFVHLPESGAAVLNGRDPASSLLAEVLPEGVRVFHYGAASRGSDGPPLDLEAVRVELSWGGTEAAVIASPAMGDVPESLKVRAIGEVYAENALAALAGAVAFGVPARTAAAAIEEAAAPPGRFEVVGERPYRVVDYAHSPDALERLLRAARRLCKGRVIVVFGAGGERDRGKRAPMGRAALGADLVIVTNDNPRREDPAIIARAILEGLSGHGAVEVILDRGEAIRAAVRGAAEEDVVLVAGRGHETEQVFAEGARRFSDVEALRGATLEA